MDEKDQKKVDKENQKEAERAVKDAKKAAQLEEDTIKEFENK